MREELDKELVEKYSHMFRNRYAPMSETCMCWGFACGDGWYNIISTLCASIEQHVNWARQQRAMDLLRLRAQKKGYDELVKFIARGSEPKEWHYERANELMKNAIEPRKKVSRVVVDQVKEKFGTLRFYYHGGDEVVDGMVRMAESMSGITCEHCGNLGERRSGGWVRTLCDVHEAEYQDRMKQRGYGDE